MRKIKAKYKLSMTEFQDLVVKQKGLCKICGEKKPLSIDHDHDSDTIRGLLCNNCNTGLGMFGDSIRVLKNAIAYLKRNG
jgi:hypothetical protein